MAAAAAAVASSSSTPKLHRERVQAFVWSQRLFMFYENCIRNECCRIKKIDPTSEEHDYRLDTFTKWSPVANVEGKDFWNFFRTMNAPVNPLHSQHEREGKWWWEDAAAKESVLYNRNTERHETTDIKSHAIVTLSRPGIENLFKLENHRESWFVRAHFGLMMSRSHLRRKSYNLQASFSSKIKNTSKFIKCPSDMTADVEPLFSMLFNGAYAELSEMQSMPKFSKMQ